LRINSAKDDAAGLAISQSMQTQINGVNQSRRNLNDATNLIQAADTSLGTIHDMLLRMKTLTTQGYDGSLSASQRTQIVDEINELNTEINATAARTKFNKNNLVANTLSATMATANDVTIGSAGLYGTIRNININSNLIGTFTLVSVNTTELSLSGTISSTYAGVTTSAIYSQTLTMATGNSSANGYQTINFDQIGISLDIQTGRTETASVLFADMTANQTVVMGGLTFTSTGNTTAANVAAAFANLSEGSKGNVSSFGTFSGTLSGFTSGSVSTSTVVFTSTTAGSNVTSLGNTGTAGAATVTVTDGTNYTSATAALLSTNLGGKAITVSATSPVDLVFQGGADTSTPNMVTYDAINIRTDATTSNGGFQAMMNLGGQVNVLNSYTTATAQTTWANAFSTMGVYVDNAVDLVSEQRSNMGALQNRISYINQNLEAYSTNLQSSRSAIMDTDFAAETAKLTKGQIMQQAATAMLAQANQMPNVVLSLLK
jgi:flagellin